MIQLSHINYDESHIYEEQKAAFHHVFDLLDLNKIAFVGGVADYLNLRDYYEMPVHDLDIIYEEESYITPIINKDGVKRHKSRFYKFNSDEVIVSEFFINGKRVHMDYFRRIFYKMHLTQSTLLGETVWHASFLEMKAFHNNQIEFLTSEHMKELYDWKRLYKHSKKAALYNNVTFLEEKNMIHTLNAHT
ncbi:hypothetical protein [Echinicola sp. 20G]|uniref:hypothetical protein n=1 Tax=Echinicola sp. 20G TaxID=2781961 RepID=UPI00191049F9|nr:hypothetical protein [Echinicola sp. 20G]